MKEKPLSTTNEESIYVLTYYLNFIKSVQTIKLALPSVEAEQEGGSCYRRIFLILLENDLYTFVSENAPRK